MIRSNEDVEMMDVENEAADEDEVASELDPDEGLFIDACPFKVLFNEQKQSRVRNRNQRMKMHLSPLLEIAIHNSPWVTKATVHTSFAETISECSIILLTTQSSTMRQ